MDIWLLVGSFAALCGAVSLIPEVARALHTHHLQDVSWGMLLLLLSASTMWAMYGLHLNDLPLVVSAGTNCCMELILIVLKRRYDTGKSPLLPKKHWLLRDVKSPQLTPATETVEAREKNG